MSSTRISVSLKLSLQQTRKHKKKKIHHKHIHASIKLLYRKLKHKYAQTNDEFFKGQKHHSRGRHWQESLFSEWRILKSFPFPPPIWSHVLDCFIYNEIILCHCSSPANFVTLLPQLEPKKVFLVCCIRVPYWWWLSTQGAFYAPVLMSYWQIWSSMASLTYFIHPWAWASNSTVLPQRSLNHCFIACSAQLFHPKWAQLEQKGLYSAWSLHALG